MTNLSRLFGLALCAISAAIVVCSAGYFIQTLAALVIMAVRG